MSKIITDLKKIDLLMSAIAIFTPSGKVLAVEKIKGFTFHIAYFKYICKNDKEIKELLKDVDFNYYLQYPPMVLTGVIPIFTKNGYAVYHNLYPDLLEPTNVSVMMLPEKRTKAMDNSFLKLKDKFSSIYFIDGGIYNPKTNEFDSFIPNEGIDFGSSNSNILYDVIEGNIKDDDVSFHKK